MKKLLLPLMLGIACGLAAAKLPPPDDAAKAKAAETAAKAAWQAKVDGYQLCKAQDRVAAQYKVGGKQAARPAPAGTAMPVQTAAAPARPPTAAGSATAPAASAAAGTPVAAAAPPPCQDPGPFAYNPPEQKPLETAGAHSPSGTAASPPSVKAHSGAMPPAAPAAAPAAPKKP